MALAYFRILIHKFLNKDTDIVPEEAPLIILGIKYAVCMAKNGKDNNHTKQVGRRVHFLRNDEKWKMHNIDLCEGGLQLAYIATNNVGGNYLNPIMEYTMVRIDNC